MHIKDINPTGISPKTGTRTVPKRIIFRTWRETWKRELPKEVDFCTLGVYQGRGMGNLPAEDGEVPTQILATALTIEVQNTEEHSLRPAMPEKQPQTPLKINREPWLVYLSAYSIVSKTKGRGFESWSRTHTSVTDLMPSSG